MDKETRAYVEKEARALLKVPFACSGAKLACRSWLEVEGSKKEKEALVALIKELKEDIVPIDGLLAFANSSTARKEFGEEGSRKFLAHAEKLKAEGATHCDCQACEAAASIVAKEKEILA